MLVLAESSNECGQVLGEYNVLLDDDCFKCTFCIFLRIVNASVG